MEEMQFNRAVFCIFFSSVLSGFGIALAQFVITVAFCNKFLTFCNKITVAFVVNFDIIIPVSFCLNKST